MKATVVIPTFNRAAKLAELLACLTRQGEVLARVVVCDDGSSDGTAVTARGFADRLPLVYAHQDDQGFRAGQARNLGIARAVGEVVVFVDDDVLVASNFVESHVAAHAEGKRPRLAVGYRSRAFHSPGGAPTAEDIARAEPDDRVAELGDDGLGIGAHPTPWMFAYSCNFSIPRDERTPRFDEDFVGWGMEDTEFGYRLHRAGYEFVAAPRARVLHIEDPRPLDPFRCEVRNLEPVYDTYVQNGVHFLDKYPDDEALARFLRTDLGWFVRDEESGRWVKNGHANDVEEVLSRCRRERAERSARHAPHASSRTVSSSLGASSRSTST